VGAMKVDKPSQELPESQTQALGNLSYGLLTKKYNQVNWPRIHAIENWCNYLILSIYHFFSLSRVENFVT
jgi:hypothetical protein